MIYQFRCECCGNEESIEIPMKDYDKISKDLKCEKCEGDLKRVYTSFGFKSFGDGYKS